MEALEEQKDIVCMAHPLADRLDYSLSPLDGILAIGQVHRDLPIVHNRRSPRLRLFRRGGSLRIYRARMDWAGVGLDYVEHCGHLHVIDIWFFSASDRTLPKVHGVFDEPTDFDRYVTTNSPDDKEPD